MKLKPQFLFDCFDPLKNVAVKVTIKDLEDHFQLKPKPEPENVPPIAQFETETKQPDIYPKNTGGSWYQLSNGKKAQGKTKALKLQKELDNA